MAYLILCAELYVKTLNPDKDWSVLSKWMWDATSEYWDEWDSKFMEIIPEFLYEFDTVMNPFRETEQMHQKRFHSPDFRKRMGGVMISLPDFSRQDKPEKSRKMIFENCGKPHKYTMSLT